MDKETSDRLLENAFKLWFGPEADRRIKAGALAPDVRIWAAQVLMNVGSPPVVRLNDELNGVFHVRPAEGSTLPEVGSEMAFASIDEIDGVTLTDEDPNAGHLTVVFTRKGYFLAFDFRYNSARVECLVTRAREFIDVSRSALRQRRFSAYVETLFAASELLAKARLMLHPDKRVLVTASHGFVQAEINRQRKHGNVPSDFVDAFNVLQQLRPKARYGEEPFAIDVAQARQLLRAVSDFYSQVDAGRPRRHPSKGAKAV